MGCCQKCFWVAIALVAFLYQPLRKWANGCVCDEATTADLHGATVMLTGSTTGLGVETAKAFAKMGAKLVLPVRNFEQGRLLANELVRQNKNLITPLVFECDLRSHRSVRDAVRNFLQLNVPLDVLILNAGAWPSTRLLTVDGLETAFQVNHMSNQLLVSLLLGRLEAAPKARIVVLSSRMHYGGNIEFDNLQWQAKPFESREAYSNTKLMNVVFSNELNRRLVNSRSRTRSLSLHPGVINTALHREEEGSILRHIFKVLVELVGKDVQHGIQTTLAASIGREFEGKGGLYLSDCEVVPPHIQALNETLGAELWAHTEKLLQDLEPRTISRKLGLSLDQF